MKVKTRAKLAARGLGPRARRRRAGQRSRAERRVAARPGPSAAVTEVPSGAPSAVAPSGVELERPAPAVEELPGVGAVLEPPPGSVRVRLRLRPAVARGLDIEAARVGMARDSLCRFVLEEMARKAVEDGPLAGGSAGEECSDASFIPAGYVGADDAGDDVAEGGSESASEGDVSVRSAGEARSPAGSAAGPVSDESARRASLVPATRVPVRGTCRSTRRRTVCAGRCGLSLWLAALVVVGAAVSLGAVATSRYAVAGAGDDGVYVVDRWRGGVWRCSAGRGAPWPACAPAVFRSAPGPDTARLGVAAAR